MEKKKIYKKRFKGRVVSNKMDKTIVVMVQQVKSHTKYQKQYTESKKFKAHDPNNQYRIGDSVMIEECRPLSKNKNWRVISKLS